MRLAVFDCDGTLVDSSANIVRAMNLSFAAFALPEPDPHRVRRVVGLSLVEAMQALLPDAEEELHRRLADDYRTAFQRLRADRRLDPEPMYPGVRDLLLRLRADGWLLGVATGKSDRGLAMCLAHHGIADKFIALHTADRHPSKPHPAMLLACLDDAGVEPDRAVIVGDTVFDMGMGVAGGVRALGVDWGYHEPAELLAHGAAAVARDSIHLEALLNG
ncbi:MAG: HAD-IA family hydrolase [Sphingomonadaceae bacterium]